MASGPVPAVWNRNPDATIALRRPEMARTPRPLLAALVRCLCMVAEVGDGDIAKVLPPPQPRPPSERKEGEQEEGAVSFDPKPTEVGPLPLYLAAGTEGAAEAPPAYSAVVVTQLAAVRRVKTMVMAVEAAAALRDPALIMQAVCGCYSMLAPLLRWAQRGQYVVQALATCHQAMQLLPPESWHAHASAAYAAITRELVLSLRQLGESEVSALAVRKFGPGSAPKPPQVPTRAASSDEAAGEAEGEGGDAEATPAVDPTVASGPWSTESKAPPQLTAVLPTDAAVGAGEEGGAPLPPPPPVAFPSAQAKLVEWLLTLADWCEAAGDGPDALLQAAGYAPPEEVPESEAAEAAKLAAQDAEGNSNRGGGEGGEGEGEGEGEGDAAAPPPPPRADRPAGVSPAETLRQIAAVWKNAHSSVGAGPRSALQLVQEKFAGNPHFLELACLVSDALLRSAADGGGTGASLEVATALSSLLAQHEAAGFADTFVRRVLMAQSVSGIISRQTLVERCGQDAAFATDVARRRSAEEEARRQRQKVRDAHVKAKEREDKAKLAEEEAGKTSAPPFTHVETRCTHHLTPLPCV